MRENFEDHGQDLNEYELAAFAQAQEKSRQRAESKELERAFARLEQKANRRQPQNNLNSRPKIKKPTRETQRKNRQPQKILELQPDQEYFYKLIKEDEKGYESLPKDSISRRSFLKTFGLAAVGTLAAPTLISALLNEQKEPKKQRNETRAIEGFEELHQNQVIEIINHIPNYELIRETALSIMTLPPNGYRGNLDGNPNTNRQELSREAFNNHLDGSDLRTLRELSLLRELAQKISPEIATEITKDLEEKIDNRQEMNNRLRDLQALNTARATSIGDLLYLSQILVSQHSRGWINKIIWEQLQKGELSQYGLEPMSLEKITWSRENRLDPHGLAWAEIMRPLAQTCLSIAPEIWFNGLDEEKRTERLEFIKENGISNPGLIAKLEAEETRNFEYIGDGVFQQEINFSEGHYPTALKDMADVAEMLEEDLGLPYTAEFKRGGRTRYAWQYVAGSLRWPPGRQSSFASGGAVFGQFMPIHLRRFMLMYRETQAIAKEKGVELPNLAPSSPWAMSLLKYLYLNGAWKWEQGHPNGSRRFARRPKGNFVVGDEEAMRLAVRGWNPYPPEIRRVLASGQSYQEDFLS